MPQRVEADHKRSYRAQVTIVGSRRRPRHRRYGHDVKKIAVLAGSDDLARRVKLSIGIRRTDNRHDARNDPPVPGHLDGVANLHQRQIPPRVLLKRRCSREELMYLLQHKVNGQTVMSALSA
jgi:hypothetical protein